MARLGLVMLLLVQTGFAYWGLAQDAQTLGMGRIGMGVWGTAPAYLSWILLNRFAPLHHLRFRRRVGLSIGGGSAVTSKDF